MRIFVFFASASIGLAEDGFRFSIENYVEPEYHLGLERLMGSDYIKRCVKRANPPRDGSRCRRLPKSCFWGEQQCDDGSVVHPTARCNCFNGRWSCSNYTCPTIGPECPAEDPETMPVLPVCSSHLTCFYSQERCCDVVYSPKWCTCEAGETFQCGTSKFCTPNNDCEYTRLNVLEYQAQGRGRYPYNFNQWLDSGIGGGGGGGGPNPNGAQCDFVQQDCPDGFKCTVENLFVDAPRCRKLDGNPDQVGDPCSKLGAGDGDSCDVDGLCLGGSCRRLPVTNGDQCALGESPISYPSDATVCEEECDPMSASSCSAGSHCTRSAGSPDGVFTCFVKENLQLGLFGDACTDTYQCQQGSICVPADVTQFGYCGGAVMCCVPLCDLSEVQDFCDSVGNAVSCQSIYNGSPPPGLEHVGACVLG